MYRLFLFYFLICFSLCGYTQANKYQFTHLSTNNGLSQSSVIVFHQDDLGQMWIGTRDGLNKYDGTNITTYRNDLDDPSSISNNDILSIEQDRDGFIWIGTYNGLNRFDPKTNTFIRYYHHQKKKSLGNNTIWTIKELSNGGLWIGTSTGLSVYDKETDSFTSFLTHGEIEIPIENRLYSILETSSGTVYLGTSNGLVKVKNIENGKYQFKIIPETKRFYIQDLIEGKNSEILIATRDEAVMEFNPKTNIVASFTLNQKLDSYNQNTRQLLFDDIGQLWVGTYDGLLIITKNKDVISLSNTIGDSKSLRKNSIKALYKDRKGSIWVGTYYGGVNIWDESNANFINITQAAGQKGLSYEVVSSIVQSNSKIYFGTEGGGINILDTKTNNYQYINKNNTPQLSNNNIKALLITDDTYLWVGSFNTGVHIYNVKTNQFETSVLSIKIRDFLKDVGVYSIKKDRSGNLWLGTFGKGLIRYQLASKTYQVFNFSEESSNSLSSNLVRSVMVDSKDNIWVGTERGLNKVRQDGKIISFFYDVEVNSGDDILTIFEDSDGTIWAGTKNRGLFKLVVDDFKSVKLSTNSIKVSSVHSILEDNAKNLWLSSNQGLIKTDMDLSKIFYFNQKEGLISNEFNNNSSLKIDKSNFYFGGPAGVTYFNPDNLTTNAYSPQVIITDLKLKNESVKLGEDSVLKNTISFTKTLNLSHDQGNFGISYAIPNFINSSNNKYKYRLKGLENDWIETTATTASYTIQNAGEYIFEVKGANSDGVWNNNATTLVISVAPAPWKSWWAFLIYALLIFGALHFSMSLLKSRTRLQTQLDLEHLEVKRTKEVHEAKLEFFTNISHEFRTPLTLILGPLHQILEDYKGSSSIYKKLRVIESSGNNLLHLINRLMDFRKLENKVFTLEAAEGNIVKFLKEIFLSFADYAKDGDYDYSFHTTNDEILAYYDRYKLERVFYNLISNAFRYTPKNGKIVLRIKQEKEHIIIQVEDSGVGIANEYQEKIFERFFEVSANKKPDNDYNKGTGIGLSIAKNIVNLHKGQIGVRDNDHNHGSIFMVYLPLGRSHLADDEIIKDFKFSDDVSQYVNQLEKTKIVLEDDLTSEYSSNEKFKILLVEDNKPLRKFMRNILKEQYNILEAENGSVALKLAHKESPDLIISDVIMPVMVGTELCAAIKENIKTSHIPIILLTSRTALVYRLEGLESGADDYISKPFDVKEFKLRIKNLLELTTRLKRKFISEDPLQPNEVIISSLDEKLFKKAVEIVENNIGNEQFDIPQFYTELGLSRTMLFTKIKAWTNFTPNEFIQHFRMKRAAQLLEQGKINISEICYKVGFRNPKYFSKCFQKKFGETPTQYANKFSEY